MLRRQLFRIGTACLLLCIAAKSSAINIQLDYTYDTNNFFAAGSQARATLEAVSSYYSGVLDDTFSAISTPAPLKSSLPPNQNPGTVTWHWSMIFDNPSAGGQVTLTDLNLSANEYRLYVGAKSLPGVTLGQGGPGGRSWSSTPTPEDGNFTINEGNLITATNNEFKSAVETRGESSGFAAWGGALTFDNDASTNWHLNYSTPVPAGKSDLFSVAFHEIGHVLGLGASDAWNARISGAFFTGPAATTAFGGNVPLANAGHWAEGTMSTIFGTATPQEALMDPSVTNGTRKRLTTLDAAALSDIGWTVGAPPVLQGDYNGNGIVDAADYTVWRNGLGGAYNAAHYTTWKSHFGQTFGSGAGAGGLATVPEPTTSMLVFAAFFLAATFRTRWKSLSKFRSLLS